MIERTIIEPASEGNTSAGDQPQSTMRKRPLGDTGLDVSVVGLGCAQLGTVSTDYGVRLVRRALELGVTWFDAARGYRDAEIKIGLALSAEERENVVLSTKAGGKTRDDARRQIDESLERMRTDYLDNCHMHGLGLGDDLERRFGPGGALEALIEAKEEGLVRHIGATAHRAETLVEALRRYPLEMILVPMNIVNRAPLDELLPLCRERGVGVTIMKPLATGLLPATLALKWLLNQPGVDAVAPGATTLEQLEENAAVGQRELTLTSEERARVQGLVQHWARRRCRICALCQPCPREIPISMHLGTDVMYDHYRTMGAEAFRRFPWSDHVIAEELEKRVEHMARIRSCSECGECEPRCPYGLPIVDMLRAMLPDMESMMRIYESLVPERGIAHPAAE